MSTETNANSIESAHDILHHSTPRPLSAIFSPQSVALIGATDNPTSVSKTILDNLMKGGFPGPIYPVNPKRPTVLGLKAYPSITAIPAKVDLAVICTPPASVPGIAIAARIAGAIMTGCGHSAGPWPAWNVAGRTRGAGTMSGSSW